MAISSEKISQVVTAITNKITALVSAHDANNNAHSTLFSQKASSDHAHGDITNDGKVGSTANKPLITSTGGKVATGSFGTSANTFCEGNDSRLSNARTPTSHTHGNISNTGTMTGKSKNVVTDASGNITTEDKPTIPSKTSDLNNDSGFITASDVQSNVDLTNYVQTTDSRLSDARTPTSHTHGDITNDGKLGSTANKPLITTTGGKITTGSFGTSANTFCQGNDSRLSDARTPTAHNQSASTITDANANSYTNIGTLSSGADQQAINSAVNTKLGALASVEYYVVTSDKGTASASTMNKLYLVKSTSGKDDNYDTYITIRSGTSGNYTYAWEKIDSTTLDLSGYATTASLKAVATSGSYSDLTNKPSYTATVTSSTTGAYKIGSINISGSSVDIYGKDTNTTYDVDANINDALDALAEAIYPSS